MNQYYFQISLTVHYCTISVLIILDINSATGIVQIVGRGEDIIKKSNKLNFVFRFFKYVQDFTICKSHFLMELMLRSTRRARSVSLTKRTSAVTGDAN